MSFFGFGAFSTPVGQLVERATDNAASAGNLALHLEICDIINDTDSGPKDAVAAIRKRLTGNSRNFHIINLTLTVLETCVKNCGHRFHVKIAQRDFLSDLMRVIQQKNNPPTIVRERILGLVQYWADAFRGKPQLAVVEELYQQLKGEGVEFPPVDLDALAPVETPQRTAPAQQLPPPQGGQQQMMQSGSPQQSARRSHRQPRGPIGPLKPEQVAKLLSELDVVRRNIDIMSEIMTETEPGKETTEDVELLDELNRVLHSMQTRVADLIGRCTDEVVLESTLQINDELNTVFVRYERWLRNMEAAKSGTAGEETAQPVTTQVANGVATTSLTEQPTVPSISYPSLDDNEPPPPAYEDSAVGQLIDLGTELTQPPPQQTGGGDIVAQLAELGITTAAEQPPPAAEQPPPAADKQDSHDQFDIFAKSRTAYSQGGSTYDDNLVSQTTSLSAAVQGRPTQQQEHTYGNLSQWLAQTNLEQPPTSQAATTTEPSESVTSAEFDQFLAQRTTKGENLPPSRPRPKMQKAEDQSDELFSL